jgi:hypothetical protein
MIRCLMFCTAALVIASSAAQQPKKKAVEPWYYKLARILGMDRAPVALKGPTGAKPGELWITPADHAEPRRLAEGNDFMSPVFQPGGKFVFVLRQSDLVRVPVAGGAAVNVRSLPGAVKLVGFDASDPDRVLVVFGSGQAGGLASLDVALVSVKTGTRQVIAARRPADSAEVASLLGWLRQYGKVYVMPQGGEAVVGGIEPVEIPVSDCRGAVCGQPAYSPELRQVAFIRSAQ